MTVPRSESGRTTLKDVARATGVSTTAVSMALADHPRIGADRKAQIRAAARELGYVTNSAARALRSQRAGSIALVVPNTSRHVFGHPYFMHLLTGVSGVSNDRDATLILSTNPDETHGVAAYERVLHSGTADGVMIASAAGTDTNVARVVASGLPVVLIGHFPGVPDAVSVGVDDRAGAEVATRHLIATHGLRRIAQLTGPLEHQTARDRSDGFQAAVRTAGITRSSSVEGDFSEESGRRGAATLLDRQPDLQAIFAANDEMAHGVLLECRQRRLRVPEDVALTGFDDFGVSRLTTPGITTVRVPAEQVGRTAAELLFDLIGGVRPLHTHPTLPVELVLRGSCGCQPTG
jgi:DNA-binding LacI/PurR family transcriptional regulator